MRQLSVRQKAEAAFSPRQKKVTIWTARHGLGNVAANHDMVVLDCRTASGYPLFKPDPNFFQAMKQSNGVLDYGWLAMKHMEQLRKHYEAHKGMWLDLLTCKRLVVTCEEKQPPEVPFREYTLEESLEAKVYVKLPNRFVVRTLLCEIAIENDIRVMHGGEIRWSDNLKKNIEYVDWN